MVAVACGTSVATGDLRVGSGALMFFASDLSGRARPLRAPVSATAPGDSRSTTLLNSCSARQRRESDRWFCRRFHHLEHVRAYPRGYGFCSASLGSQRRLCDKHERVMECIRKHRVERAASSLLVASALGDRVCPHVRRRPTPAGAARVAARARPATSREPRHRTRAAAAPAVRARSAARRPVRAAARRHRGPTLVRP